MRTSYVKTPRVVATEIGKQAFVARSAWAETGNADNAAAAAATSQRLFTIRPGIGRIVPATVPPSSRDVSLEEPVDGVHPLARGAALPMRFCDRRLARSGSIRRG